MTPVCDAARPWSLMRDGHETASDDELVAYVLLVGHDVEIRPREAAMSMQAPPLGTTIRATVHGTTWSLERRA